MLHNLTYSYLLPLLFTVGLVGGTVDAIAGGGGLISLPVLLSLGLPPQVALGTNKLQGAIGTFLATHSYHRQGWFSLKSVYKTMIMISIGTIFGAIFSQVLNSNILQEIIPIFLTLILIYFIASPKPSHISREARINSSVFSIFFGLLLGFYDGFFGPGVGAFWMFGLIFFLGYNINNATAHTKIFNLTSNLVATICFALGNCIDYRLALCMALGQIIGGKLGAHLAIKKGAALIRPIFLSIVFFTVAKLFYKNELFSEQMKIILLSLLTVFVLGMVIWNLKNRYLAKNLNDSH